MNVTFNQLASVALQLISKSQITADDQTLYLAQNAREMLHRIETGALLVVPKPEPKPEPQPTEE